VGIPQFETNLKAGATWSAKLTVPEDLRVGRQGDTDAERRSGTKRPSVTWIVEVTSQIIFSSSASVKFEVLLGRDEKSLDYSLTVTPNRSQGPVDGHTKDNTSPRSKKRRESTGHQKGVYSRAINLVIDDTESLWDKPPLPVWEDSPRKSIDGRRADDRHRRPRSKGKKNVHLVIVTHGLHSNLGADMLYCKESIDATARAARVSARIRRNLQRQGKNGSIQKVNELAQERLKKTSIAPLSGGQDVLSEEFDEDSDPDDEEVIVRGFPGNAMKTENGIQYLGKRLARYILDLTYPDQPVRFMKKRSLSQKIVGSFHSSSSKSNLPASSVDEGLPSHDHSTIQVEPEEPQSHSANDLAYTFTSISFVGHSLGGLIQLYAIAYIQKHAPKFFDQIKPVNFVTMASPLLGLSNENPYYVRFALDLGLVGSTGRDLGLNWRAPRVAKTGWSAVMSGFSGDASRNDTFRNMYPDAPDNPGAKPLLRVLPTGPAHLVLRKFRNRTVYSNVVNDGIVPLRTSCLLFLDWRGLGKVEKARRDNGLIGTVVGWGWAEMMGQSTQAVAEAHEAEEIEDEELERPKTAEEQRHDAEVPQPPEDAINEDDEASRIKNIKSSERNAERAAKVKVKGASPPSPLRTKSIKNTSAPGATGSPGALDSLLGFLRLHAKTTNKDLRMFKRSQTISMDSESDSPISVSRSIESSVNGSSRTTATSGDLVDSDGLPRRAEAVGMVDAEEEARSAAPPKTTIFESAADLLSPPTPSTSWILDPSTRARTIFHDRVYHPEDIPPPPIKHVSSSRSRASSFRGNSSSGLESAATSLMKHRQTNSTSSAVLPNPSDDPPASTSSPYKTSQDNKVEDSGLMRVEEKIARAYHRDLSWRKVLVRLEPDAHNNMIVRRTFANAYGWPVIKHMCDTHFADTWSARTRDENEPATDRAKASVTSLRIAGSKGEEVKVMGQDSVDEPPDMKKDEMVRHGTGELEPLEAGGEEGVRKRMTRQRAGTSDSVDGMADDSYLDDTSDEEEAGGNGTDDEHLAYPPPGQGKSTSIAGLQVPSQFKGFFSPTSNPGSPSNNKSWPGHHTPPASAGRDSAPSTPKSKAADTIDEEEIDGGASGNGDEGSLGITIPVPIPTRPSNAGIPIRSKAAPAMPVVTGSFGSTSHPTEIGLGKQPEEVMFGQRPGRARTVSSSRGGDGRGASGEEDVDNVERQ
jgi:hypothetical protein